MDRPTAAAVDRFNALRISDAERWLHECCAAPSWVREVAAGRPYPDAAALMSAAAAALAKLSWPDMMRAVAAHPRIGERPAGSGHSAAWSRQEQSGVQVEGRADLARALAEVNQRYEERFGHVFLICATGKDTAYIIAQCQARLGNPVPTEQEIVRAELGKIVQVRLAKLAEE